MNAFALFCWLLQFSEAYAKNVTNFNMSDLHLWALITLFQEQIYILPNLKIKSRLALYWSFISGDKNVEIPTIYVNNMNNPKMKAFNSYFSVHEARHDFFSNVKNGLLKVLTWLLKVKYQRLCFFVAITVTPRRWVQVISRHLDNMMLVTTVVCGIRFKKIFLEIVYWLRQFLLMGTNVS